MSAARTSMILSAARTLIADPRRWTTHASARDSRGLDVPASAPSAVCWCAAGAIARVVGGYGDGFLDAVSALHQQLSNAVFEDLPDFNDRSMHPDVLALFDGAILEQETLINGHA